MAGRAGLSRRAGLAPGLPGCAGAGQALDVSISGKRRQGICWPVGRCSIPSIPAAGGAEGGPRGSRNGFPSASCSDLLAAGRKWRFPGAPEHMHLCKREFFTGLCPNMFKPLKLGWVCGGVLLRKKGSSVGHRSCPYGAGAWHRGQTMAWVSLCLQPPGQRRLSIHGSPGCLNSPLPLRDSPGQRVFHPSLWCLLCVGKVRLVTAAQPAGHQRFLVPMHINTVHTWNCCCHVPVSLGFPRPGREEMQPQLCLLLRFCSVMNSSGYSLLFKHPMPLKPYLGGVFPQHMLEFTASAAAQ